MKNFLLLTLLLLSLRTVGQQTQGIVNYDRTQYWTRINSRMTFLSNEEKDRMKRTWGDRDGWTEKMKLVFTPEQSLYTYGETEPSEGGYSWRRNEFFLQRDFAKGTKTEIQEMLGKTYILEDSLRTPNWKIMNQIKDVAGYVCMKAVTEDPIRNQKITAWFAQDLPVSAGPEQYHGLPGLILELELNEGDVVITATSVQFRDVSKELVLPKVKGKKIKQADYNTLVTNHIRDSIKAYRNPYWAMRY